jgi:hypothetical protein
MEAWSRGPKGETLEGAKAMRGADCGPPGNTGPRKRIFRMHQSLKPPRSRLKTGPEKALEPAMVPGPRQVERLAGRRSGTARGAGRAERRGGYRKGETSEGGIPGALRHETRPKGQERNKASRGRESLEAQHSRARQTRCRSLLLSESAEGAKNPTEGPPVNSAFWQCGELAGRRARSSYSGRETKGMGGAKV